MIKAEDDDWWGDLLTLAGDPPPTPAPVAPELPLAPPHEPFVHLCHCGKWGAFGYGVRLAIDEIGQWYCRDHRPKESAC